MDTQNLTAFQMEQLIHFFGYYMSGEQRDKLMATLPRVYNAWCGRKIVKVVQPTFNDAEVAVPLDKCEEIREQNYQLA
jgi:hypothetical protein